MAVLFSRLLPADLYEATQQFAPDRTLQQTITDIQEGNGKIYACPKCVVGEVNTGMVNIDIPEEQGGGTVKVICDVCNGYMKTDVQYESYCEGTAFRPVAPPPPEE